MGSEDEEAESEESDLDEDEDAEVVAAPPTYAETGGYVTPAPSDVGTATPSGITTIPGVETPDTIELRKKKTDER